MTVVLGKLAGTRRGFASQEPKSQPLILLEVCNLANTEDRRLLETREFRDRIAQTIVIGILRYYGDSVPEEPEFRVASSAG